MSDDNRIKALEARVEALIELVKHHYLDIVELQEAVFEQEAEDLQDVN